MILDDGYWQLAPVIQSQSGASGKPVEDSV
jgi:hypothetical protein